MKSSFSCPRAWELDALREGRLGPADAASFERHLTTCASCAHESTGNERLRELARQLPARAPDPLTTRRMRRRILDDAATQPSQPRAGRRSKVLLAAACLASLIASVEVARRGPRTGGAATSTSTSTSTSTPTATATATATSRFAGSVSPSPEARWTQVRENDLEQVTLNDGTLDVHVRPQGRTERFVLLLPDGSIEVRGTRFEVTVDGGRTRDVRVAEGVVELRLQDRPVMRLAAGDAWPLPERAVSRPPGRASLAATAQAAPAPDAQGAIAPEASTGDEARALAYSRAVSLLTEGRNDYAALALHAFLVSHPDAPQAEDASFLEAVALARAGRVDAAGLAAEDHLARFPRSFHGKDATLLVERAARWRDAGAAKFRE